MSTVMDDLQTWGPDAERRAVPSDVEAAAYCRRLASTHYENFPVISWLLPHDLRQHFANVYAYCRWADDLGDETGSATQSRALLAWWRGELECCYRRDAWHPVFVALRETIVEFEIPKQPFVDLLEAFEQDQHVRRYETFDDLADYCRRSANPVGQIVLHLCRRVDAETLAWSDSICTGLQLANFWQDVSRDFDMGRVYLPGEDRERFGYLETDLQHRTTNDAFLKLMEFEVDRARDFLEAGRPLVAAIPGRLQISVEMFLLGGLQILKEIERIDFRVWDRRPVVSRWHVARLFALSTARALMRRG